MWSEVEEDMLATLLPFHRRIVEELIKEDGLCILSSGMGWQKVVSGPPQSIWMRAHESPIKATKLSILSLSPLVFLDFRSILLP
jgi:hypothetical protein